MLALLEILKSIMPKDFQYKILISDVRVEKSEFMFLKNFVKP